MTLLEEIQTTFPDIQPADIVRVLSFLGFDAEDINSGKNIREIKGVTVVYPGIVVWDDLKVREVERAKFVSVLNTLKDNMINTINKTLDERKI